MTVLAAAAVAPARADGGRGGTGDGGCAGGAGGVGFVGSGGGNGSPCNSGGGGGAAGGGPGGAASGVGGSGGNGGNNGTVTATLNNSSSLAGGDGGTGIDGAFAVSNAGGGGGGGAGGVGAVVTGITGNNTSAITGGRGGDGGNGANGGAGGGGGSGGDGGAGVLFTVSSVAMVNASSGTVRGGNGGNGGNGGGLFHTCCALGGDGGAGGIGVDFLGTTASLTNAGAVNGGKGGDSRLGGAAGHGGDAAQFVGSGATLGNTGTLTGGNGGAGSSALSDGGNLPTTATAGGTGGNGVSFLAASAAFTNSGSVVGGNGGTGGQVAGLLGSPGSGGAGGVGAQFSGGGTLTNTGTISGGNGGSVGSGTPDFFTPTTGRGGAGVVGSDLTIINSGTISGGLSGDGTTRANAVSFTGGVNTLELRAGSNITGNVAAFSAADTLRFGGSSNAAFNASQLGSQYQGFGAFDKTGNSTWSLSGTNNLATPWTVDAGTLQVNAVMAAAPVTVNNMATLTGSGSIGSLIVKSGGAFVPGSVGSPGTTMTIAGNLAFQSGALYLVQFTSAGGSRANVGGTAALAGTLDVVFFSSSGGFSQRNVLLSAAGGASGTFDRVQIIGLPNGLTASIVYTSNAVLLNFSGSLPTTGLTGNQRQVASAINTGFANGGSLSPALASLFGLSGSNLANALQMAAGETATGSQQTTFQAMGQFMGLLTDPFVARGGQSPQPGAIGFAEEDGASAYAATKRTDAFAMVTKAKAPPVPFVPRWSVWAAGFGGSQSTDGNVAVGSNNTTSSVYGTSVGADYLLTPNTLLGFALAGGGTNFSVSGFGSGRSDLFQAGAYARTWNGPAYVTAALAYGWQDITTNRAVTLAGVDQLRAEFNANAYSGRVEGGYRFVAPWTNGIGVTPYAAAQFTTFDLPAYAERALTGTTGFALAYGAKSVTDPRSELGLRTDTSFVAWNGIMTLRGRVAWAHDFDPNRSVAATFQSLPGASFVVNGAAQASDSALTTASAEMKWSNGWSTAATFEGEFSNVTRSYAGRGVVRYVW